MAECHAPKLQKALYGRQMVLPHIPVNLYIGCNPIHVFMGVSFFNYNGTYFCLDRLTVRDWAHRLRKHNFCWIKTAWIFIYSQLYNTLMKELFPHEKHFLALPAKETQEWLASRIMAAEVCGSGGRGLGQRPPLGLMPLPGPQIVQWVLPLPLILRGQGRPAETLESPARSLPLPPAAPLLSGCLIRRRVAILLPCSWNKIGGEEGRPCWRCR